MALTTSWNLQLLVPSKAKRIKRYTPEFIEKSCIFLLWSIGSVATFLRRQKSPAEAITIHALPLPCGCIPSATSPLIDGFESVHRPVECDIHLRLNLLDHLHHLRLPGIRRRRRCDESEGMSAYAGQIYSAQQVRRISTYKSCGMFKSRNVVQSGFGTSFPPASSGDSHPIDPNASLIVATNFQ